MGKVLLNFRWIYEIAGLAGQVPRPPYISWIIISSFSTRHEMQQNVISPLRPEVRFMFYIYSAVS